MDVRKKKKHEKEKPCQVGGVGRKRGGGAGGRGGRGGDDSGNCDAVMLCCAQSGLAPAVGTATSGTLRQQQSREMPTACLPQLVLLLTNSANKTHRHIAITPHLPNSPQCGCSRQRRILLRQYGVLRIFPVVDDDVSCICICPITHSLLHSSWRYICCSRSCQSCFISLNRLFVCMVSAWIEFRSNGYRSTGLELDHGLWLLGID